jgi:hypothetical protein
MKMSSWDFLAIAGIVLLLMYRLERLGRQIEAISMLIREEFLALRPNEERRAALERERRGIWTGSGIVGEPYWTFPACRLGMAALDGVSRA